jgi:hypothetical protein
MSNGNRGVLLPKNMFVTNSYNSPYRTVQRGGRIFNNGPILVDWGLIFNLSIFTIFVCSIFYICLYRYRNKQKIRKETEIKQKKIAYEFQKAYEDSQKDLAVKKYNQILENKRYNQMMVNANLDNLRLQMNNPYLLNDNNSNNYTPQFNTSSDAILNGNLNIYASQATAEFNSDTYNPSPKNINTSSEKLLRSPTNININDMYQVGYDNFDFNKTNQTYQNKNSKNSENNKGYDMLRDTYSYKTISY